MGKRIHGVGVVEIIKIHIPDMPYVVLHNPRNKWNVAPIIKMSRYVEDNILPIVQDEDYGNNKCYYFFINTHKLFPPS